MCHTMQAGTNGSVALFQYRYLGCYKHSLIKGCLCLEGVLSFLAFIKAIGETTYTDARVQLMISINYVVYTG